MVISLAEFQEEIVFHPARFQIAVGGRRVGKSWTAADRLGIRSLRRPKHRSMFLAPVASQCDEVFENMMAIDGIQDHIAKTRTRPNRVWFENGSRTEFRSLERPRNIRGKGLDDVIVDESQDVEENTYDAVIRPLVSDKQGSILLLGQFRGRDWRYKKFFAPGADSPGTAANPVYNGVPLYKSWKIPSRMGPAFQTDAGRLELEIAEQQLPSFIFKQEYECEITANPAAVFPDDQLKRITRQWLEGV